MTQPRIPVGPVREAVERSGVSLRELARRLDWWRPDDLRVARRLGRLTTNSGHGGGRYYAKTIDCETALSIVDAVGADPVDLGL